MDPLLRHFPPYRPPPEMPKEPMEFLSRSWSLSSAKTLSSPITQLINNNNNNSTKNQPLMSFSVAAAGDDVILECPAAAEDAATVSGGNASFSFASSETSQLVMERIMSHSQEVSPRTSGRLSHSSGPLNGSLTDSPPDSPSDDKFARLNNHVNAQNGWATGAGGGGKTVGRWLKDRREKKKEEARTHNAQLQAAVTVAGVAAAVAAIAAATAASSGNEQREEADMAMASAATLVAAQCVEAAEAMGVEREHLTSVVGSAVNVRTSGDIVTLTAAAATALRGAATLKARALKDVWNMAAVIPMEKGAGYNNNNNGNYGSIDSSNGSFSGELIPEDNFLGICTQELLTRGCELLKRTRKGDLHWKVVSVYINRSGEVMLKMKSRIAAGTLTKKKKNEVLEVMKDMPAWPGRHLLEGGENRRYFALKTVARGVVEFECRNQKEYDIWTQGVCRLLSIAAEKNGRKRI